MKAKKQPATGDISNAPELENNAGADTGSQLSPLLFSWLVTGVFAIIIFFGLFHHEMWRDELQAWLVARDADSLPQLLINMRYEGNPALWHFFLFIITRFTHDPVYMQVLHFFIACGFIFVFNRYATIDRLYKILFSFGYFVVYEYSVISRSYGLALLLIFIVCALYRHRSTRYILIGSMLALLANVTVYGMVFSIAFAAVLALDYKSSGEENKGNLNTLIAGLTIVVIGIILSVYQILPEKDNTFPITYASGLFQFDRWGLALSRIFTTLFYVPQLDGMNFWNTNCYFENVPGMLQSYSGWLSNHPECTWFWFILPVFLLLLSSIIFMRKPLILLLYISVMGGLLSLYYYTNLLFSRYCGFVLIVLIVCYWLENYYPEKEYEHPRLAFLSGLGKKLQTPFLVTVLTVNILGAAVAYAKDYSYDFSVSKKTADYICENKLDTMTVTGAYFYIAAPLAAYLDTKLFYYQLNSFGSFSIYNEQVRWDMPVDEINKSVMDLIHQGRTKLLIVSSYEWTHTNDGGAHFESVTHGPIAEDVKIDFLKSFDAGIVDDEHYYLYLIHK